MNKLYKLIDKLDIELDFVKLPDHINGLHFALNGYNLIIINQSLHNTKDIKSIIGEELGHYYTSNSNNTPLEYSSEADNMKHDKCEFKALRWACDYLIDTQELLSSIDIGSIKTKEDILEHYDVTENIVDLKFYYMSLENQYYPLSDGKILVLSSLPSIIIYEPLRR